MALITIMAALRFGRFHFSLAKNPPMTFPNLVYTAQKYCNANKLTNAKKQVDQDP